MNAVADLKDRFGVASVLQVLGSPHQPIRVAGSGSFTFCALPR